MSEEVRKLVLKLKDEIRNLLKPGLKYLDLAEYVEKRTLEEGAEILFPTNISVNSVASHDTAKKDDDRVLKTKDVVKVDFGLVKNNIPIDTAICEQIDSDEYREEIEFLTNFIHGIPEKYQEGDLICKLGSEIEKAVALKGYTNLTELSGHSITLDNLHSKPTILNFFKRSDDRFFRKQFFTVEIFITKGPSLLRVDPDYELLELKSKKYPVCKRWLEQIDPNDLKKTHGAIINLSNNPVFQIEETFYVNELGEIEMMSS